MSFTDLLRSARASRATVIHKFLTNYDPNSDRVFGFVEGDADEVFYRAQINKYLSDQRQIYLYNCEGKKGVFSAYEDIVKRYPACERVLFFVDKDLDEIVGAQWPSDPRIFTTEYYSVENFIVSRDSLSRYFKDYVKIRRVDVDVDAVLWRFDDDLRTFHRLMLPVMAWIVVAKRSGARVNLHDLNPGELFQVTDGGTSRKSHCRAIAYLCRVCQVQAAAVPWNLLRRAAVELSRLPAKSYVRGKFEAWWFVEFGQLLLQGTTRVVHEGGGSVRITAPLSSGTFIQLLAASVGTPPALDKFLSFHTQRHARAIADHSAEPRGIIRRIASFLNRQ